MTKFRQIFCLLTASIFAIFLFYLIEFIYSLASQSFTNELQISSLVIVSCLEICPILIKAHENQNAIGDDNDGYEEKTEPKEPTNSWQIKNSHTLARTIVSDTASNGNLDETRAYTQVNQPNMLANSSDARDEKAVFEEEPPEDNDESQFSKKYRLDTFQTNTFSETHRLTEEDFAPSSMGSNTYRSMLKY